MEGRQTRVASFIANGAIDSLLKSNTCGLICKLDIEKTYDHVNWNFLLLVLNKMGFGDKWVRWIKWCISIVSFSVIVNDSPLGFFQSSRRLR